MWCLKTSLGQTNCQLWTGGAVCGPPTRVIPLSGRIFYFYFFVTMCTEISLVLETA